MTLQGIDKIVDDAQLFIQTMPTLNETATMKIDEVGGKTQKLKSNKEL